MSFDDQESSREDGKPVLLFYVRYGRAANNFYAYTNTEEEVTFNNVVYKPVSTDHSGIRQSGNLDRAQSTWTLPHNNELAIRFRSWPPSEVISLRIFQGHIDNPDFRQIWTGRILSAKLNDKEESVLTLERINTSLQRTGLRRRYSLVCPHLLYGQGEGACNADRTRATFAFTVATTAGGQVTMTADWTAKPDAERQKFLNGVATWTTTDDREERRQIVEIRPNGQVVLGGPATGMIPGSGITLTWGCNHLLDDCKDLHHNSQNFGGQWLIPTQNPIGVKNNYY